VQETVGRQCETHITIPSKGLTYADSSHARRLHTQAPLPQPPNLQHIHHNYYFDLFNFIDTLAVQPFGRGASGITWIELLILFQLRGGWKDDLEESSPTIAKASTKATMKRFQHALRKVANMHIPEADLTLFRSATTTQLRLKPLGFTNHMAKLSFVPDVTEEEAEGIANALLSMRPGYKKLMQEKLTEGTLQLKPCKLSLRSRPRWSGLPPDGEHSDQRRQDINARISATQDHHIYAVAAGMTLHLHCPKCDMARVIGLNPFRKGNWLPAH
jgi:hypothetical protein